MAPVKNPIAAEASTTTARLQGANGTYRVSSASGAQSVYIIDRPDSRDGERITLLGTSDSNYIELDDTGASSNLSLSGASRTLKDGETIELVYDKVGALWTEVSYSGGGSAVTLSNEVTLTPPASADSATTTNIMEVAFSTPVDTTGTNTHQAIVIDCAVANATGGTNTLIGLGIDGITGDAQVTAIAMQIGVGWDQGIQILSGAGAANSASGLLLGGGTTAAPCTSGTADDKFIEFRCESTATSGDNRLAYFRYALEGAAGGGECLRAFTVVNENVGTAHGAHLSLVFEAAAGGSETSGLGAAVRGTTHIPDVASWAPTGTVCSGMFELYSDGSNSDPAGLTELSVLRLCNSGDATGLQDVDTDAFILSLQGWTEAVGTTNAISSTSLTELPAGTKGIRVKIGSDTFYIPAVAAAEWN